MLLIAFENDGSPGREIGIRERGWVEEVIERAIGYVPCCSVESGICFVQETDIRLVLKVFANSGEADFRIDAILFQNPVSSAEDTKSTGKLTLDFQSLRAPE